MVEAAKEKFMKDGRGFEDTVLVLIQPAAEFSGDLLPYVASGARLVLKAAGESG